MIYRMKVLSFILLPKNEVQIQSEEPSTCHRRHLGNPGSLWLQILPSPLVLKLPQDVPRIGWEKSALSSSSRRTISGISPAEVVLAATILENRELCLSLRAQVSLACV